MVEVASSNLVTPTRFESPNLYDWGFFYAHFIGVVAQIESIYQLTDGVIRVHYGRVGLNA